MPSSRDRNAHTGQLHDLIWARTRQLMVDQGLPSAAYSIEAQNERRASALATLRACVEFAAYLDQQADAAAWRARANHASYTEIGAARGTSRQAARQGVLRKEQEDQREQQRRRAEQDRLRRDRRDGNWEEDLSHHARDDNWPPRAWQYHAPTGLRTVTFIDGPAIGHTERIPVGDDAFPFIDYYQVFRRRHPRHARYTAVSSTSNQYRFTGEYFVRWT